MSSSQQVPNLSTLKGWTASFKVADLNNILLKAGLSRYGKKVDLQKRLINYLSNGPAPAIVDEIIKLHEDFTGANSTMNHNGMSSNSMRNGSGMGGQISSQQHHQQQPSPYFMQQQSSQGGMPHRFPGQINRMNVGRSHSGFITLPGPAPNTKTALPMFPSFTMKESPFYTPKATLHPLMLLTPGDTDFNVNRRQYDRLITFNLDNPQAEDVIFHRRLQPGQKVEFGTQILLRFCRMEPPYSVQGEMDDSLPIHLVLTVNQKAVSLPPILPSNKPNTDGRRPPRAISITSHVLISPVAVNQVRIQWQHDYQSCAYYCVSVLLVKRNTPEELCNVLVDSKFRSAEFSKGIIRLKLNADYNDEGIEMSSNLPASLRCPLGMCRIRIPVRAEKCKHLQCFDANLYLSMNDRKSSWRCPFCDGAAPFKELYVDGLYREILASPASKDVADILLHEDGTWKPAPTDEDPPSPSPPTPPPSRSLSVVNEGEDADPVIDLTSDDEEETTTVRQVPSRNGSSVGDTTSRSNGDSGLQQSASTLNQTVITLSDDSDSEDVVDRTPLASTSKPVSAKGSPEKRKQPSPAAQPPYKRQYLDQNAHNHFGSRTEHTMMMPPQQTNDFQRPSLPTRPTSTSRSFTSSTPSSSSIPFGQLPQQPAVALDSSAGLTPFIPGSMYPGSSTSASNASASRVDWMYYKPGSNFSAN